MECVTLLLSATIIVEENSMNTKKKLISEGRRLPIPYSSWTCTVKLLNLSYFFTSKIFSFWLGEGTQVSACLTVDAQPNLGCIYCYGGCVVDLQSHSFLSLLLWCECLAQGLRPAWALDISSPRMQQTHKWHGVILCHGLIGIHLLS